MISLLESILSSTNAGKYSKPNRKYFSEGDIVVQYYQYDYTRIIKFFKVVGFSGSSRIKVKELNQKYDNNNCTTPMKSFAEKREYDDSEFSILVKDDGDLDRAKDRRWVSYYKWNGKPVSRGGIFGN